MRFFTTIVAALAVVRGAFAVDVQKSIIVSYPDDTSDDIIHRAMDDIKAAGGKITHEYNLIKGFAATAPQKFIESVTAWTTDYHAVIEDDGVVGIAEKNS